MGAKWVIIRDGRAYPARPNLEAAQASLLLAGFVASAEAAIGENDEFRRLYDPVTATAYEHPDGRRVVLARHRR